MAQVIQLATVERRAAGDSAEGAMMTAQMIAERLRQMRGLRGLSQKQLAEKCRPRLDPQTISRLENARSPARKATLVRLARGLDVDPDVLTGGKPLPLDAVQSKAAVDATAHQLNVRLDAATRNAFELAARRYKVSVSKIAQLAPLLFVLVAEKSLEHRRKKLDEFEVALDHVPEPNFPHRLVSSFLVNEWACDIRNERDSISSRDILGSQQFSHWGEYRPLEDFLNAVSAGHEGEISIRELSPTSTEYRVCTAEAIDLAKGDRDAARWLLNGEVLIHHVPRGLKTAAERLKWMRDNRKPVHRVAEEIPEPFPEDDGGISASDLL